MFKCIKCGNLDSVVVKNTGCKSYTKDGVRVSEMTSYCKCTKCGYTGPKVRVESDKIGASLFNLASSKAVEAMENN